MKVLRRLNQVLALAAITLLLASCGSGGSKVKEFDDYALSTEKFENINSNVLTDIGVYNSKLVSWYNSVEFSEKEMKMSLSLDMGDELIEANNRILYDHINYYADDKAQDAIAPACGIHDKIAEIVTNSPQQESITDSSSGTVLVVSKDDWKALGKTINDALDVYYGKAELKHNERNLDIPEEVNFEESVKKLEEYTRVMGVRTSTKLREDDVNLFGRTGKLIYSDLRSNSRRMQSNETLKFYDENDEDYAFFFASMYKCFVELYGDPVFYATSAEVPEIGNYLWAPGLETAVAWKADKYTWAVVGLGNESNTVMLYWSDVYSDYGKDITNLFIEATGEYTLPEEIPVNKKPFDIDVDKNELAILSKIISGSVEYDLNSDYDVSIRGIESLMVSSLKNDNNEISRIYITMYDLPSGGTDTCINALTEMYGPYDKKLSDNVDDYYVWDAKDDSCSKAITVNKNYNSLDINLFNDTDGLMRKIESLE